MNTKENRLRQPEVIFGIGIVILVIWAVFVLARIFTQFGWSLSLPEAWIPVVGLVLVIWGATQRIRSR